MSWLRKALAQAALSRSQAALLKASGGVAREARGYTLDARFQYIEDQERKRPLDWDTLRVEALRAREEARFSLHGGRKANRVRAERVYLTSRSHSTPARLYLPLVRDNSAAMLVYFHGGLGVSGAVERTDRLCSLIAKAAGAPVLSPAYRLAPEYKFSTGLDDAVFAYRWAVENAARYGATVGRAAVGGDGVGAGFAARIAQELRAEAAPVLQLLISPQLDYTSETASMRDFANAFPLTDDLFEYAMRRYLPDDADPSDARASPGRAQNLAGLAPALIYLAGFDMLLDQGSAYADRLQEAGVAVTRALFEDLPHGFAWMPAASPAAEAACQRIARETAAALKKHS